MLQIDLWKRIVIWGLCIIGLFLALPNAFYTRVEGYNDTKAGYHICRVRARQLRLAKLFTRVFGEFGS